MKDELLNEIRDHVKEYEGYSQLVYECTAGYATIGYGRNLEQRGITKEESEYILVDMCYNLGLSKLLNFENMLDAIDARNWQEASEQLLDSRYAAQVKRRARINASYLLACAGE